MYKVASDPVKNRLYITLETLDTKDVKPILSDLNKNIAALTVGFTCLVDIRLMKFDPQTKGSEYVEIVQGALADSGMSNVVRVINKEDTNYHLTMDELSISLGYKAKPAYSLEEAENILDKNL
ncbi:MAG: hypothetical protein WC799_01425 [Desulfobacteraceae bacterium]|jgi:hypothetical protein